MNFPLSSYRLLTSAGFIPVLFCIAMLSGCDSSNAVGANIIVINDTEAPVTIHYEKSYNLIFVTYYSHQQIDLSAHQQRDLTVSLKLNRYEISVIQGSEEIRYRNDLFKRVVRISPGDFKPAGNG